ncbi:MAG: sodium:calcium antiporter [Planctomycetota bacterium]
MTYVGLALCLVCIFVGGSYLTSLADKIAHRTRLGHHLMGTIFLAAVTSVPELGAGLSAVGRGFVDIAVGEVVGSCGFNLMILGVAALVARRSVFGGGTGPLVGGLTGILLLGVAIAGLVGPALSLGVLGTHSLVIAAVYVVGLELLRRRAQSGAAQPPAEGDQSLRRLWLKFGVASIFVMAPAVWLPDLADDVAKDLGISHSFVGTFLVGAFTSTPEIMVTYHCVRAGLTHMAVGNLLGSNLFNVLVLAVMDAVYLSGPIYGEASPQHTATALLAIVMTLVVLAAGRRRPAPGAHPRRRWEGLALCLLYAAGCVYLFGD